MSSNKPSGSRGTVIASAVLSSAAFFSLTSASFAATPAVWTNGSGSTLWGTAGNWDIGTVPDGDYAATIGTPAPVILNLPISIPSLDITAGGALNISNGQSLSLSLGRTMTMAGSIIINPEGSAAPTSLNLPQFDLSLSGGGTIRLNSDSATLHGSNAFVNLVGGTQIVGFGTVDAVINTSGSAVIADQPGQTLNLLRAPANGGVVKATNGATLALTSNGTTGGQLVADNGLFRISDGNLLLGAVLNTANGGEFDFLGNGTGATLQTATNNGKVVLQSGAELTVKSTFTNNGSVFVGGGSSFTPTGFFSNFDVTYNGTGEIVLGSQNSATISTPSFLNNNAGHTIRGLGAISAGTLVNQGTVAADQAGGTLTVNGSLANLAQGTVSVSNGAHMTIGTLGNSGLISISGGGTLSSATVQNDTGTISFGAGGGTVSFPGGLLVSSAGGPTPLNGKIVGSGTVDASVTVSAASGTTGGSIAPGTAAAAGQIDITGSLTLTGGHLSFDLFSPTLSDLINDATANLGGTLDVTLVAGYHPSAADLFVLLNSTGTPNLGSFSNALDGQRLTTTDGLGSFLVRYPAGSSTVTIGNFALVPEPATASVLGVAVLALKRRRGQSA